MLNKLRYVSISPFFINGKQVDKATWAHFSNFFIQCSWKPSSSDATVSMNIGYQKYNFTMQTQVVCCNIADVRKVLWNNVNLWYGVCIAICSYDKARYSKAIIRNRNS